MMRHRFLLLLALSTVGAIYIAAVLSVAVANDPASGVRVLTEVEGGWRQDVEWSKFLPGLRHLSWQSVGRASGAFGYPFLVGYALGWLAVLFTMRRRKSLIRALYFFSQLVFVWRGWMGLLMIPITIEYGVDGEWFSEGWPVIIAWGIWLLCSFGIGVYSFDWNRVFGGRVIAGRRG